MPPDLVQLELVSTSHKQVWQPRVILDEHPPGGAGRLRAVHASGGWRLSLPPHLFMAGRRAAVSTQAHLGLYPPLAMRSRPFPEGIMGLTN